MGLEVQLKRDYEVNWDARALNINALQGSTFQSLCWNVNQQKGYRYTPERTSSSEIHQHNEDSYFPTKDTPLSEYTSKFGDRIFLLADGHSGHEASRYFISRISKRVLGILNAHHYQFSNVVDQQTLTRLITDVFVEVDAKYIHKKTIQYKEWIASGSNPKNKPMDDGCTMVLNVIQHGWVLNCNVGDSRTVLCRPSVYQKQWVPFFASSDHNMMHPHKVSDISRNGGKFLNAQGTSILNVRVDPPELRKGRLYHELHSSRLYRPTSESIRAIGCSHKRTLNLTGTMGDLLFKIHPPVLSCVPDFSFIRLEDTNMLIMATDGIWDHLYTDSTEYQNEIVVQQIVQMMEELGQDDAIEDVLGVVCGVLVDREGSDIYAKDMLRYDDATLMIIHVQ